MNSIFQTVNLFFHFLFYPLESLNPMFGIIWISLITGIIMLIIFRYTSNQEGIRNSKRMIGAYIIEMRLFSHHLGKMLFALGRVFRANLLYLRFMLVPLVFIVIPVLIVLIQTSYKYEFRPLEPREAAIVKAVLKPDINIFRSHVELKTPAEVIVETPPLRIAGSGEVYWRVSGKAKGVYELVFLVDGKVFRKNIHIGGKLPDLSVKRIGSSFSGKMLYHAEPVLPEDSPFTSLQVGYPKRKLSIVGFEMHWIVWFLIFSVIFSFAFKSLLKVEL